MKTGLLIVYPAQLALYFTLALPLRQILVLSKAVLAPGPSLCVTLLGLKNHIFFLPQPQCREKEQRWLDRETWMSDGKLVLFFNFINSIHLYVCVLHRRRKYFSVFYRIFQFSINMKPQSMLTFGATAVYVRKIKLKITTKNQIIMFAVLRQNV